MKLLFPKVIAVGEITLLACLVMVLGHGRAIAQNRSTGEIRGTVTDPSGAVVPGVKVAIINTQTGVQTAVTTNSNGIYEATFLVPGVYLVRFSKLGFKRFVRSGINLEVQVIAVNARLEVGSTTQQVTVRGGTPLVQTETSRRSTTISASTVQNLPNVGQTWFNYTALMPGVSGGGGQNASGDGVGINGAESYQENWLMNGGSATFGASQNPTPIVSTSSDVQEVDLDTHNFSAQYGNGTAVFNVITKGGTNKFHGSLFEYDQNNAFSARNFFAIGVPPLRWNDFGGNIGGPIKRDKAFFFFNYESQHSITYPISYHTYPTAAMRQGNFSAPGLPTIYDPNTTTLVNGKYIRQAFSGNIIPSQDMDPVAAKIQQYYPLPNLPGLASNYYFTYPEASNLSWWTGKVDYNIAANNRLEGLFKYYGLPLTRLTPTSPIGTQVRYGKHETVELTDSWTLSPTMVNAFHVGILHTRQGWHDGDLGKGYPAKIGLPNLTQDAFPNISVTGAVPVKIATGTNAILGELTLAPSDTFTWVKGKHILKIGGEFDRWQVNRGWPNVNAGAFTFNGIFSRNPSKPAGTGLGYADFLMGLPSTWSVTDIPTFGARLWSVQLFVQDDYKVKPNLTLNLGLRYQIQPGWTETFNRLSNFDPAVTNPATGTLGALWYAGQDGRTSAMKTAYKMFAPRIGFAWSPKNNWSIRGAYGLFYMQMGLDTYGAGGMATGWKVQGYKTATNLLTPIFTLSQGPPNPITPTAQSLTPDLLNGQSIGYLPYDTPVPYLEEWQFDIQHQLPGGLMIDAGYVGSHGVHLPLSMNINQVPPSLISQVTTGTNMQSLRPYPQFSTISTVLSEGISNYNAFQLTTQKRFEHGLQFIANYTWSKTLDMETGSGWSGPNAKHDVWQNVYDPGALYALSLLDMPQVFTGDFIYQLPFGSGRRFLNRGGILNGFLGGWQVSSLWQVHSGIPFTPVIATANLSGSLGGSWFPNRLSNGAVSNPTIQQWFNPSAFAVPSEGTFGNSGRNILFGPSWKGMDVSLAKHFAIHKLGEGGDLEIRVDAQNAFNHPNFGQPNEGIGHLAVGTIHSASGGRILQLGARLSF